ncbi:MAG: Gfo/Idh/MocA family oxidoreductase [Planctomycetota bacterium]
MAKRRSLGVLGVSEGKSILFGCERSAVWETACICDLDDELCKLRMSEYSVGRYTLEYDEMLADPDIDVIAIYTPDPMHADHCIKALEAGKHVICTKPLVDDLAKGRALLDAVEKSGKSLMVGMSCRFFATFMQQREIYQERGLGEIQTVEAHYHGDKRVGTSGKWGRVGANNWIYTGLVHPTDLVYWYAGMPEEVFGYGSVSPAMQGRGFDVPDNYHFVLKGRDGKPHTVSGFYGTPTAHPEAEGSIECTIRGSEAAVNAHFPDFQVYTNFYDEGPRKLSNPQLHSYYYPWGGAGHHAGEFQNYLECFAEHLDGKPVEFPDVKDGLRVVAVLRAMEISMNTGKPVNLPELLSEHGLEELA